MEKDETIQLGLKKIEIDISRFNQEPDYNSLYILPTRNLVLFPGLTVTFELGRSSSLALARRAERDKLPIGIVCQLNPDEENPAVTTGLYKFDTLVDLVRTTSANALKDSDPAGIRMGMAQYDDQVEIINFLCTNLPFEAKAKSDLLAKSKIIDRAMGLLTEVNQFADRIKLTENIMKRARRNMEENQKNAFLQQQMEAIRETLYGDESTEADELLDRAEQTALPDSVMTNVRKEIEKLRRYNPTTPDYSVLYTYLDTLLSLPWGKYTTSSPTITEAAEILENDHYGLEKVKERIVEQLALLMHNPDGKSPILCLVGPPGVGKTSIGKSVAKALGRKYERVSFGGLHDEAEIRGHRRTYIGAMPGRIIDAMKRAGVANPVLVLDEIDKIGHDYKGDPGAALLEVLDPEQNCHFHDTCVDSPQGRVGEDARKRLPPACASRASLQAARPRSASCRTVRGQ